MMVLLSQGQGQDLSSNKIYFNNQKDGLLYSKQAVFRFTYLLNLIRPLAEG